MSDQDRAPEGFPQNFPTWAAEFEHNIGARHRPPEVVARYVPPLAEPVPFSVRLEERRQLAGPNAPDTFGYERPRVNVGHADIKRRS